MLELDYVDYVMEQTLTFLKNMPKSKRKNKGQFFTSANIARFMAKMFDAASFNKNRISILDPGTGTGILSVAFIERVLSIRPDVKISLTCHEIDSDVLLILKNNLEYIRTTYLDQIYYQILEEDYITSQSNDFNNNLWASENPTKYDFVISHPPYFKVMRNNAMALTMSKVIHAHQIYISYSLLYLCLT